MYAIAILWDSSQYRKSIAQGAFHVNCTPEIRDSYYNYIVIFVSPRQRSPPWSTWNAHWSIAQGNSNYSKVKLNTRFF